MVENSTPGKSGPARRLDLGRIVVDPADFQSVPRRVPRQEVDEQPVAAAHVQHRPLVREPVHERAERAGQGTHHDMQPRRQPLSLIGLPGRPHAIHGVQTSPSIARRRELQPAFSRWRPTPSTAASAEERRSHRRVGDMRNEFVSKQGFRRLQRQQAGVVVKRAQL